MTKRIVLVAVALAFVVAACGSSGGSDSSSTTAAKSGGSSSGGAGGCSSYSPGKDGIIQTFCDGSAKVTLTLGGKTTEIDGGTCATTGGQFTVNAGVVAGQDFKAAKKPDYFGALLPTTAGAFSGPKVLLAIVVNGSSGAMSNATGTRTAKSGSFSGTYTDVTGNNLGTLKGTFTC